MTELHLVTCCEHGRSGGHDVWKDQKPAFWCPGGSVEVLDPVTVVDRNLRVHYRPENPLPGQLKQRPATVGDIIDALERRNP